MAVTDKIRVEQADVTVVLAAEPSSVRAEQFDAVAIGGIIAKRVRVSEADAVGIGSDEGKNTVLRVEQADVVVIAAVGDIPEQPLDILAFRYDLDGHLFYGIHVAGRGTFVYDFLTQQWSRWQTADFTTWNAQYHVKWNGGAYAASMIDSSVIEINPDSILDDSFRTNTFLVSGRLETQSRRWLPNGEVHLLGSIGDRGGDIVLRYSDDDGATFGPDRTVTVTAGDRDQSVLFQNLGSVKSPGRIYQIEDEGTLRRVQSLRSKIGEGDA